MILMQKIKLQIKIKNASGKQKLKDLGLDDDEIQEWILMGLYSMGIIKPNNNTLSAITALPFGTGITKKQINGE